MAYLSNIIQNKKTNYINEYNQEIENDSDSGNY